MGEVVPPLCGLHGIDRRRLERVDVTLHLLQLERRLDRLRVAGLELREHLWFAPSFRIMRGMFL
jgi:hypothetical protein